MSSAASEVRAQSDGEVRPVRVALVGDDDVVEHGLRSMLRPFGRRVLLVDSRAGAVRGAVADLSLREVVHRWSAEPATRVSRARWSGRRVVYTWDVDAALAAVPDVDRVAGFISKSLPAAEIVEARERVRSGERIVARAPGGDWSPDASDPSWPGRASGLSRRQSEILGLIARGLSNRDVAAQTYLELNTIKSHVRATYQRIGVENRSRAIIWALSHGFGSAAPRP